MIPLSIFTYLWWRLIVHHTYCFLLRDWYTTLLNLAELFQIFALEIEIACTAKFTARVHSSYVAERSPIDCEADGSQGVKYRSLQLPATSPYWLSLANFIT